MIWVKKFLRTDCKNGLLIDHYWARVGFPPGSGKIHLQILGIEKGMSYVTAFHKAKTLEEKKTVMEDYATIMLVVTDDMDVDENCVVDTSPLSTTTLGTCFHDSIDDE